MTRQKVIIRKTMNGIYVPFEQATPDNPLLSPAYDELVEQAYRCGLTDENGITICPCKISGGFDLDPEIGDLVFTLTLVSKLDE